MIKLQNGMEIHSDGTQLILCRKKVANTEKKSVSTNVYGYYTTLEECLNGYLRNRVLEFIEGNDCSLTDVLDELRAVREEIKAYR